MEEDIETKRRRKMMLTKGGVVVTLRKLKKEGSTYYVSIPKEFVEKHDLKEGDILPVLADNIVKIVPVKEI